MNYGKVYIRCGLLRALDKATSHQLKPVQRTCYCGFGNCNFHVIVDELFHTDYATAIDMAKIDDTIKTPWDPNKPIKMLVKQIDDTQIFPFAQSWI